MNHYRNMFLCSMLLLMGFSENRCLYGIEDIQDVFVENSSDATEGNGEISLSTFEFQRVMSLPLPLSQEIPIALSQQNQWKYLKNPVMIAQERTAVQSLLQAKTFPLLHIFTAFVLLAVLLLVRVMPVPKIPIPEDSLLAKQARLRAAEQLKCFTIATPKVNESASAFFLRLEEALRGYLDSTFHLGATTSTSEELEKKDFPYVDERLRIRVIEIIRQAENIKFSRKKITEYECHEAVDTIKHLVLHE